MREWLIALGILVIVAVLLDCVRRMRNARRDSVQISQNMYGGIDRNGLELFDNDQGISGVRVVDPRRQPDDETAEQASSSLTESGKRKLLDLSQSYPILIDVNDNQPRIEPGFGDENETADEILSGTARPDNASGDSDRQGDAVGFASDIDRLSDPQSLSDEAYVDDLAATLKSDPTPRHASNGSSSRPVLDSATVPLSAGESDVLSPPRVYERPADRPPPRREPPVLKESKPVVKARQERELKMQQQDSQRAVQQLPLEDVIIISVMTRDRSKFPGTKLLEVLLANGLRYGHRNIFHRYIGEENEDESLYKVAKAVNPGTFDLSNMDSFNTPGVTLFMPLPTPGSGRMIDAFESMLATARSIAESLNGELKDENRSVMTAQTIEHCRQRVRDFEMQSRLRAPR